MATTPGESAAPRARSLLTRHPRRAARWWHYHQPLAQIYLNQPALLRRSAAVLAAQTGAALAEVSLLVTALSTAGTGWALAGWAAASASHIALDYRLRATFNHTADAATSTLWQRLAEVATSQRGAGHGTAFTLPGAEHVPTHVASVHTAAKHHLPFILTDTVSCLSASMAAAVVVALTHSGLGVVSLVGAACAVAVVGHRALLLRAQRSTHLHHQQQATLVRLWQRMSTAATAEFTRRTGNSTREAAHVHAVARQWQNATRSSDLHRLRSGVLSRSLTAAVMVTTVAAAVSSGSSLVGVPVVFLLALQALSAASRLPDNLLAAAAALPSSQALSTLLRVPPRVAPPSRPRPLPHHAWPVLEVAGVNLRHAGGPNVLTDVQVRVGPGQALALTGAVRAGKTSLLRLLARLDDPTSGTITLAGVNLRELSFATVDAAVVLMPAVAHLEPGSVIDNVRAANPRITEQQALEALRLAGLRLDEALLARTNCTGLSSGQSRQVELARVLVSQAPVVLLDEPSTNLDPAGVQACTQVIDRLRQQGRVVVVATHNLDVLPHCTHRLHLEQGRPSAPPRPAAASNLAACNPALRPLALPVRSSAPHKPAPANNHYRVPGHSVVTRS